MTAKTRQVYVVQESPNKNLLPAAEFGEVTVLLPPGNVVFSAAPTVRRLREGLKAFSDSDYLLLIGDPAAIAIASAIAAEYNRGHMNLLKWDRQEQKYFTVEVNLNKGWVYD